MFSLGDIAAQHSSIVDNRLTIQRPGYGVYFEKVAEITDDVVNYGHTWMIRIPRPLDGELFSLIDCDTFLTDWTFICASINQIFVIANENVLRKKQRAHDVLQKALQSLPKSSLSELVNGTAVQNSSSESDVTTAPSPTSSEKTSTDDESDDEDDSDENEFEQITLTEEMKHILNTAGYQDAFFINVTKELNVSLEIKPGYENDPLAQFRNNAGWQLVGTIVPLVGIFTGTNSLYGNVLFDLFDVPGPRALAQLKDHLSNVGEAVRLSVNSFLDFTKDLASIFVGFDERDRHIVAQATALIERINLVREKINQHHEEFLRDLSQLYRVTDGLRRIEAAVLTQVLPAVNTAVTLAEDEHFLSLKWAKGISRLASGWLTTDILPESMISSMLTHINLKVLSEPFYSGYALVSNNPKFYYKTPREIRYAVVDDTFLVLSVDFPLNRIGGTMPLYQVKVFPVPVGSGITPNVDLPELRQEGRKATGSYLGDGRTGYTRILNMPDFIAVSEDTQAYVEMSNAQYLGCDSVGPILTCSGSGFRVAKLKSTTDFTCAFSIFRDIHENVQDSCDIGFTNEPPLGSAQQIRSDASFLVRAAPDDIAWTLSCPKSLASFNSVILPCSFCRVEIPCGCSLTAAHFHIPVRLTGCNESSLFSISLNEMTVIKRFTRNTAVLSATFSRKDLQSISSFEEKLGEEYPAFEIPQVHFSNVSAEVEGYIEKNEHLEIDYKKSINQWKKNESAFAEKIDEALNKTTDFSDQVVDRAGNAWEAIKSFFSSLLGGQAWKIISYIFSPMGISLIALILSALLCCPVFAKDVVHFATFVNRHRQMEMKQGKGKEVEESEEEEKSLLSQSEAELSEAELTVSD